ncbi:MAG TPA: CBS domain-containing protein [Candidatus Omnitrophica bacterium]|nr:CBS domain-containing protein [Candidatus Omnitrophota bacterium]
MGIIDLRRLVRYIFPHILEEDLIGRGIVELVSGKTAEDLIPNPPVYVTDEDSLDTALSLMVDNELEEIPVVDNNMRVIGDLNLLELVSAWRRREAKRRGGRKNADRGHG